MEMEKSHLEKEIGKYKLDDLLILNSTLSRGLFLKGSAFEEIEIKSILGALIRSYTQYLTAWGLSDLSYIAIKNSNDYRLNIPERKDVIRLNNFLIGHIDDLGEKRRKTLNKADIKAHILFGLSQKEFWYQDIVRNRKLVNSFLRYYILLDQIPPKYFPQHRQPKDDLIEITGFDIQGFSQLLLAIWSYILTTSVVLRITVSNELKEVIPLWTEENIQKCIQFFTGDYNFYRSPSHSNNPLFFRPIIKTDTGKLVVSNVFILGRKFYEGIYWLIRDEYRKKNSQLFIKNFGAYYEKYIEEVLNYYLESYQFEKIETGKGKKADWLINTKNYLLVVEQKSCLMTVALKEEYPALPELDKYLENFKKAYLQIENTVSDLGNSGKVIIKLVLHFETFYVAEVVIKERINKLCETQIKNLANYFLIDTEEFERLIQALSENENIFDKIIKTKIGYESNTPPGEGREFKYIINKHYKTQNIKYLDDYIHCFDRLFGSLFLDGFEPPPQ